MAAFILKLVEMRTQRDGRVLVYLGFFCVVVGYLFDASLPWALYSLLPIVALLTAMIGLQHTRFIARPWATLKLSLRLLAQALPLMLLLFVCFPRLDPLWSLPLPSNKGTTGLSDSMSPGDIADLGRSAELVMRVSFDGAPPKRSTLYWRALTLDRFDGVHWSQSGQGQVSPSPSWQPVGPSLNYRVIQEPTQQPWLFVLDVAKTDLPDVRQLADYRLQRKRPVDQALLYSVNSWPQVMRDQELASWARRQTLQLPNQGDPRSRDWARQLAAKYPRPDALVDAVLRHFRNENYYYTLRPPPLSGDTIDGFLFGSRRGFCGHYAGAMTFVLRAAGIPARVVIGYQGGELNPDGNYLTVRQFDAHAWVEYWQAGQGWRSVDPTAAVAPQRIEAGPEAALAADDGFLENSPFSPLRFRHLGWLNDARLAWDNANYLWQRWVLGYQSATQLDILNRWFQGWQQWILPAGLVLILLVLALLILKPRRRQADAQLRQFEVFERLLARYGLLRETGEGAQAFAARAMQRLPHQAPAIQAFAQAFAAQRYAGAAADPKQLNVHIKALRRRLSAAPRPRG